MNGICSLKINNNVVNLCEMPMNHTDKKGNKNSKVLEITVDWGLREVNLQAQMMHQEGNS